MNVLAFSMLFLPLLLLAVLVMVSDIRSRLISNRLCVGILMINSLIAFSAGYLWQTLPYSALGLMVFGLLWLRGVMGGGDVKLLLAFSVGISPVFLLLALCAVGLLGGVQVVWMYLAGRVRRQPAFSRGIPYGIPVTVSGLIFTLLSFLAVAG